MEQLQILWVTSSDLPPDAGVKSHSHPYFHMFHIATGAIAFSAGGNAYELEQGHTFLVPPGTEHGYTNRTKDHSKYLEIKFTLPSEHTGIQYTDDPLVKLLFEQILKEYSDLGSLADDAAAAYLKALLAALEKKQRYEKQPRQFHHVDASDCSELSQQIIHYLEAHYNEDLSLDSLAQALGYNKSYLCVAFKKDTQQTILDCLNTIRIRRAAELIVYSDLSLTQVSEKCGFSSVSHFNRVFLKYAGTTPGQCRRAYPADILTGAWENTCGLNARSDYFMYSVLAQKSISIDIVSAVDQKPEPNDQ